MRPLKYLRTVVRALRTEARFAIAREDAVSRFPHVTFGEGVIIRAPERFEAGEGCFLDTRAYLSCGGGAWNGDRGYIRLGKNCEIGPYCVLWGAGGIQMGNDVHIGAHVHMTAHEALHRSPDHNDPFKPLDFEYGSIIIEDHVIICSGTNIIPGVRIGHHSMIGAGAVIIGDIPPYSLAVGVPAKIVKTWDGRELEKLHNNGFAAAGIVEKWVP